jgi:type I restriction enzyme S subunit
LQNILSSSQVREKLTNEAVGVTMKNLNAGIIKNLVVPLPPTNLQKHFLDFSKKVNLRKVEMQFAKNKISEGFNSLMQDAFKGELDLT